MMIHEITQLVGKYKKRKRIGRGQGSGFGKTSGRGHKGAHSRAGFSRNAAREGGQIPYFRRIPKRGFTNNNFRTLYHVVNVRDLEARFSDGQIVNAEALMEVRLIRDTSLPIKVLGDGELTKKLEVTAAKVSASAREKIDKAGGKVTLVEKKKWTRAAAAAKKAKSSKKDAK